VAVIEREGPGLSGLLDFEARTLAAMRAGFDYICQGGFFDVRWYGRAEFLRRVEPPSLLGDWSYEVEDTKLARRLKVAALIQTADYSRHVARLQGRVPRSVHIVLGDNTVDALLEQILDPRRDQHLAAVAARRDDRAAPRSRTRGASSSSRGTPRARRARAT